MVREWRKKGGKHTRAREIEGRRRGAKQQEYLAPKVKEGPLDNAFMRRRIGSAWQFTGKGDGLMRRVRAHLGDLVVERGKQAGRG